MKIKKIDENFDELDLNSLFYMLNSIKPFLKDKNIDYIEFLKSLNLTKEQYIKISEIIDEYGSVKYDDGKQDCLDQYDSWRNSDY